MIAQNELEELVRAVRGILPAPPAQPGPSGVLTFTVKADAYRRVLLAVEAVDPGANLEGTLAALREPSRTADAEIHALLYGGTPSHLHTMPEARSYPTGTIVDEKTTPPTITGSARYTEDPNPGSKAIFTKIRDARSLQLSVDELQSWQCRLTVRQFDPEYYTVHASTVALGICRVLVMAFRNQNR